MNKQVLSSKVVCVREANKLLLHGLTDRSALALGAIAHGHLRELGVEV